jgi:hypothetical protein
MTVVILTDGRGHRWRLLSSSVWRFQSWGPPDKRPEEIVLSFSEIEFKYGATELITSDGRNFDIQTFRSMVEEWNRNHPEDKG